MSGNGLNFATRPETLRKAVAATRDCSICGRAVRASSLVEHENRHRIEQQTKPCETCGRSMGRLGRYGERQWNARRFCSNACRRYEFRHRINRPYQPPPNEYVVAENGCWVWQRAVNQYGYGVAYDPISHSQMNAHRVMWFRVGRTIPDGYHLDHLCRNKLCVNPDHMEPVTPAENNRRAAAARSHCRHGHPLDGVRSYGRKRIGRGRYCLTCHRERETLRREARRVRSA